jgi:putative transposase
MINQRKGWHTRGYLPHYDGHVYQFLTFHLFDSLPQSILAKFQLERENGKLDHYDDFKAKIETYLDQGIGDCYLGHPEIAEIMRSALHFYAGNRYRLIAWTIMPNHVHLLILPLADESLSNIVKI